MDEAATEPSSDTEWQAIDIYVFSNGQQSSPPRKYHLKVEDINLWKTTLAFLAQAQYGPYHSTIDLYTTEGRKIWDPLQLSNGGSYVAVQPPDAFIEAGYDKYLLKASRSWEKRRSKRNENAVQPDLTQGPNLETVDDNVDNSHDKLTENVLLKSRASSSANHNASTIIKPQLMSALQRKSEALYAAKQTEKKKTSILSPFVKKNTPSSLPVPSFRNSISKKRDSKSIIKPIKPDDHKQLASLSGCSGANAAAKLSPRLSKCTRTTAKSKDPTINSEIILPNVLEKTLESSSVNIDITNNDNKLPTKNTDLKSIVGDKGLVANLYQNQYRDVPSIYVSPNNNSTLTNLPQVSENLPTQFVYRGVPSITIKTLPEPSIPIVPLRNLATTTITSGEEIAKDHRKSEDKHENSDIRISIVESKEIKNNSDIVESSTMERNVTKNNEDIHTIKFSNNNLIHNVNESSHALNNEIKINIPTANNVNANDSPSRRLSIKVDLPDISNINNNVIKSGIKNFEVTESTRKSSETIKILSYSSPPRSSTDTNKVLNGQNQLPKNDNMQEVSRNIVEKPLTDQYKATLRKGDVINFKLNIEIESNHGSLTRQSDNFKCQSAAVIHKDKGCQSNNDDHVIAQNKSLLSLITKDINESHNVGDNNQVIILRYDSCKYCKEYNAKNPNNTVNTNFVILVPNEKFEELKERCHCNETETQPEIQLPVTTNPLKENSVKKANNTANNNFVIVLPNEKLEELKERCLCNEPENEPEIQLLSVATNPITRTYSYTSLSRKPREISTEATSLNIGSERKSSENCVTVTRKKSVAINEETTLKTCDQCEQSKTFQEVDVKTELITISVESVGKGRKTPMKNSSTQTEWCDLLLEAILLNDGHYTFRLPPLGLLKRYKLT